MKSFKEYLREAEVAPQQTAPAPTGTPATAAPAQQGAAPAPQGAAPAQQPGQQFKPNQTMDPQQAAQANKIAQDFMAQLTAKVKTIAQTKSDVLNTITNKPVSGAAPTTPVNEQQLDEGVFDSVFSWVKEKLDSNPLIEIGLRLIPATSAVLAALDVVTAVKSGSLVDAAKSLASIIPGGQQVAQAIGAGQAVASGDPTAIASAALPMVRTSESRELDRILALSRHYREYVVEAEAPQNPPTAPTAAPTAPAAAPAAATAQPQVDPKNYKVPSIEFLKANYKTPADVINGASMSSTDPGRIGAWEGGSDMDELVMALSGSNYRAAQADPNFRPVPVKDDWEYVQRLLGTPEGKEYAVDNWIGLSNVNDTSPEAEFQRAQHTEFEKQANARIVAQKDDVIKPGWKYDPSIGMTPAQQRAQQAQQAATPPAKPAAEDMHRLRKLSGITEKDIDEAPEPGPTAPTAKPAAAPTPTTTTQPAPKPANPPPMPPAGQQMDLSKVDNDTLFGKYQQLQSTLNFMQPQTGDKQMATNTDPASQNMIKGMQDQLAQADKELKTRGYNDQQLKPAAAPVKPLDQSNAQFKEDLEAMLRIARLR